MGLLDQNAIQCRYSHKNNNKLDLPVVLFWNVLYLHKTLPVRTKPSLCIGRILFLDTASGVMGEPVSSTAPQKTEGSKILMKYDC